MAAASQPTVVENSVPSSSGGSTGGVGAQDIRAGVGENFLALPRADDAVIARVGSEELKKSQVFEYMRSAYPEYVNAAVSVLLSNRIIAAQCDKFGITVPLGEVAEWYQGHRKSLEKRAQLDYGPGTTVADWLKQSTGQTEIEYETAAVERERTTRLMQRLVRYLEIIEDRVELRIISSADRATAERLVVDLKSGADFGQLARQFSLHPSSKNGGAMFPVWKGALNPALEEPVFATAEGELGPIVRVVDESGQTRWQIFRIVKKHPRRDVLYRDVERDIVNELSQRPFAQDEWLMWQLRANRLLTIDLNGLR